MKTLYESILDDDTDLLNDENTIKNILDDKYQNIKNINNKLYRHKRYFEEVDMIYNPTRINDLVIFYSDVNKLVTCGYVTLVERMNYIFKDQYNFTVDYISKNNIKQCSLLSSRFINLNFFNNPIADKLINIKDSESKLKSFQYSIINKNNKDLFNNDLNIGDIVLCNCKGKTFTLLLGVITNINDKSFEVVIDSNIIKDKIIYLTGNEVIKINENQIKQFKEI